MQYLQMATELDAQSYEYDYHITRELEKDARVVNKLLENNPRVLLIWNEREVPDSIETEDLVTITCATLVAITLAIQISLPFESRSPLPNYNMVFATTCLPDDPELKRIRQYAVGTYSSDEIESLFESFAPKVSPNERLYAKAKEVQIQNAAKSLERAIASVVSHHQNKPRDVQNVNALFWGYEDMVADALASWVKPASVDDVTRKRLGRRESTLEAVYTRWSPQAADVEHIKKFTQVWTGVIRTHLDEIRQIANDESEDAFDAIQLEEVLVSNVEAARKAFAAGVPFDDVVA